MTSAFLVDSTSPRCHGYFCEK